MFKHDLNVVVIPSQLLDKNMSKYECWDEDKISDQIYKKQICSDFYYEDLKF